ncbi:MAG: hypothetical protein R2824_21290 [Saprospiraceae bacterium]
MSLPTVINLKRSALATWPINQQGKLTSIRMRINDPGATNNPSDPGDEGAAPTGVGMFYSTDSSTTNTNKSQMAPKFMGWLNQADEAVSNLLAGTILNGFLLLPVADTGSTLTIGVGDGDRMYNNPNLPFTNAASLNYTIYSSNPGTVSSNLPLAGDGGTNPVNTSNIIRVNSYLYKTFTRQGANGGVMIQPQSIEKTLQLHFVNDAGSVLCVLDSNHASGAYWIPFNGSNIYLVAAVQTFQDQFDENTWHFNIGDPRTDGSMTVTEF